jgi:alpha-amylase
MNERRKMGKPALTFVIVLIVSATTGSSLFAGGDPLDSNSVVFQTFYWDVPAGGTWYNTIKDKAPGLKSAGFTHFWFPPPTKGASGGYSMGYDLYDNYDLGNYYQKGTVETRFGSLSELQAAAAACGNVLLDLVANHMTGGEQCVDQGNGQTYWQLFQYVHHTFEKNCSHFHPGSPDDCDLCNGLDNLMFEDVCHKSSYMFDGQRNWASWMKTTVGNVSGFRLDAVKHFSWNMSKEFGTVGSCIGEYWDNKTNIMTWVDYTGNYAFDFPLYEAMKGSANALDGAGLCSNKGVSFVNNHDTERLPDKISQKSRAYGYIMYITPTPSVFWSDWFDSSLYPDIRRALEARNTYDFSGTGTVYKSTNLIIFNNNRPVYGCFNSAVTTGSGTITASPSTTYRAIAWGPGNRPSDVTSDGSGSVTLTVPAKGYCYWYGGNMGSKAAVPDPVNEETDVNTAVGLSWLAGDGAVSHNVYFGTDYNDVNDAADPNVLPGRGNQTATTFNPGILDYNTTYYWRIDEKNAGGTTTGNLWSFTVRHPDPLYKSAYDAVHVPGDETAVFGSWWDPAGADNEMTLIADYTWQWESSVSSPINVWYKFAMDGRWATNRGLGSTSGSSLPQNNSGLIQDGGNINANLPRGICIWKYYENTETSRLYTIDFNADGIVNLTDFAIFANHWLNQSCAGPNWCGTADLNRNGSVDFYDLAELVEYWLYGS